MKFATRRIAFAGILAAVYAAVTLATASFAYGPIQFRIAEALSVLCCFTPAAVPGMVIGCMVANLASSVSIWDILIGTVATLLAVLITRWMSRSMKQHPWIAWLIPLPTILCNALIVGLELAFFFPEGKSFLSAFGLYFLSVGAGEAAVMYVLGMPLLLWLRSSEKRSGKLESL